MPYPAAGGGKAKPRGQYRGGGREIRDDDDPKWAICVHCGKFFPFDRTCKCMTKKEVEQ